jgi:hypothetical protein
LCLGLVVDAVKGPKGAGPGADALGDVVVTEGSGGL